MPANAGIQKGIKTLDSRIRGNDERRLRWTLIDLTEISPRGRNDSTAINQTFPGLLIVFTAAAVAGGFAIPPAWAEDAQAKPALSAATAPRAAAAGETAALVPEAVRPPDDGPAEPAESKKKANAIAAADDYRIGQNDLLEIKVFQADPLNRSVRVSSSGYISMPLIGLVEAGGLTALELERLIATKLEEKYMHEPQVSVFISEYTSQRVTIEGYVKNPGIYVLKGRTTLMQALAMSAGIDYVADINTIRLHRVVNGEKKIATFDLEAIRSGKAEDPVMRGNDIVVVDSSGTRSFIKGLTDTLRGFVGFGY